MVKLQQRVLVLLVGAFATVLFVGSSEAHAGILVDINSQGGPAQGAPYVYWDIVDPSGNALNVSQSFADAVLSTDGTIDVTIKTGGSTYGRNYDPITDGTYVGLSNLMQDIVFFNNKDNGKFFEVELNDLVAGTYCLKAYHHAFRSGGLTGLATTDILHNGVDTGQDATMGLTTNGQPTSLNTSLICFSVANDGDPVTIRFANPTAAHFGLNGFELTGQVFIPEPSTLWLLGLGVAGLAIRRRRRKP